MSPAQIDDPIEGQRIVDPEDNIHKWYVNDAWRWCLCVAGYDIPGEDWDTNRFWEVSPYTIPPTATPQPSMIRLDDGTFIYVSISPPEDPNNGDIHAWSSAGFNSPWTDEGIVANIVSVVSGIGYSGQYDVCTDGVNVYVVAIATNSHERNRCFGIGAAPVFTNDWAILKRDSAGTWSVLNVELGRLGDGFISNPQIVAANGEVYVALSELGKTQGPDCPVTGKFNVYGYEGAPIIDNPIGVEAILSYIGSNQYRLTFDDGQLRLFYVKTAENTSGTITKTEAVLRAGNLTPSGFDELQQLDLTDIPSPGGATELRQFNISKPYLDEDGRTMRAVQTKWRGLVNDPRIHQIKSDLITDFELFRGSEDLTTTFPIDANTGNLFFEYEEQNHQLWAVFANRFPTGSTLTYTHITEKCTPTRWILWNLFGTSMQYGYLDHDASTFYHIGNEAFGTAERILKVPIIRNTGPCT
jgi:hypothetical protein